MRSATSCARWPALRATRLGASAAGIKQALEAIRAGTDIDLEGHPTADNWDKNGDVLTGAIEIFRIVGGEFETVKTVPVDLSTQAGG